jgi:hypothetical protein
MDANKLIDKYFNAEWIKHPIFAFFAGFLLCLLLTA